MTILIVADNPLYSIGLRSIIESQFLNAHIFETDALQNSLTMFAGEAITMLILDAGSENAKEISLLLAFKRQNPDAVILVNLDKDLDYMYTFIRAGVNGLISKKSNQAEITEALKTITGKTRFLSNDVQQLLLTHIVRNRSAKKLTRREIVMANLLSKSKTPSEIALITGVRPQTVTLYKKKIFEKLQVHNIIELRARLDQLTGLTE